MAQVQELDDHGFPMYVNHEQALRIKLHAIQQDVKQTELWNQYISDIHGIQNVNFQDKKFKALIRGGIPMKLRPYLWCKITGSDERLAKSPGFYEQLQSISSTVPESVRQLIELDVPRTFDGATAFTPESLRKVLMAFALVHPEIGYCQSLNFIAALLIYVLGEESALWTLVIIVEKYMPKNYYQKGLYDFQVDLKLFELLIEERCPDIFKQAKHFSHEWMTTISGWLLTAFANCLPTDAVFRIWDSLFFEGQKITFRIGISLLRLQQDALLAAQSRKVFTQVLTDMSKQFSDTDTLMDVAFKIKLFSRKHLLELRDQAKAIVDCHPEQAPSRGLYTLFGQLNL